MRGQRASKLAQRASKNSLVTRRRPRRTSLFAVHARQRLAPNDAGASRASDSTLESS